MRIHAGGSRREGVDAHQGAMIPERRAEKQHIKCNEHHKYEDNSWRHKRRRGARVYKESE